MAQPEELSWFRQLAASVVGASAKKTNEPTAWKGTQQWRAFELADVMEQGLACEITSGLARRPPPGAETRQLTICRSEDRLEHVLLAENSAPLMVARHRSQERCIDFYVTSPGDPPRALGPAFKLFYDGSRKRWQLFTERCERCEYRSSAQGKPSKRQLFRAEQERREIGLGFSMHMEVEMPDEHDFWCEHCCGCSHNFAPGQKLVTRSPKWNDKLKSLTLDYRGRCSRASAKNFQVVCEDAPDDVLLQFGKMGEDLFCLDVAHPFGTAQAFALALTSSFWQ